MLVEIAFDLGVSDQAYSTLAATTAPDDLRLCAPQPLGDGLIGDAEIERDFDERRPARDRELPALEHSDQDLALGGGRPLTIGLRSRSL